MSRSLFTAGFLLLITSPLHAALVGSFSSTAGLAQINPVPPGGFSLRFSIGPSALNCFNLGECVDLVTFASLDGSSVGQTALIDGSHPNFAAMLGLLTNGVADFFSSTGAFGPSVPAFPGGGSGYTETNFGAVPGPDLVGRTIGLVTLRIDSVAFSQVMLPDLRALPSFVLAPYTQAEIGFTLSVYESASDIPEPGSLFLGATGLGAAIWAHNRRRASRRASVC